MAFAGMEIVVPAPRSRTPRSRGRISAAVVDLPAPQTTSERAVPGRFLMGVKLQAWPMRLDIGGISICGTTNFSSSDLSPNAAVTFAPFMVSISATCSTLQADFDQIALDLEADMDLAIDQILGAQIATSFKADSSITTNSTAVPAARGLGRIDDALLGVLFGGTGTLWTTSEVVTSSLGAIMDEASGPTGIESVAGSPIAIDSHFGSHPTGGSTGANESWIYGSSAVYAKLTPAKRIGETWEDYDYARNIGKVHVQQFGVIAYDPSMVVAQKVCLPACP